MNLAKNHVKDNALFYMVVLSYFVHRNLQLERQKFASSLNAVQVAIHVTIFLLRTIPEVIVRRLLGLKGKTKSWGVAEDIIVRSLRFLGQIGDVGVPNTFLNQFTKFNIAFVARPVFGVHIVEIPASKLGFAEGSLGRKRFGKDIGVTALWMTLDPSIKFGDEDLEAVKFFVHGGGFVFGNAGMYLSAHGQFLRELQKRGINKAGVLSLEYPLAPQVKAPIPTESCFHVFDHLVRVEKVLRPEICVVAGDSAGGNIALNIALRATKWGTAGAMLISPWVGQSSEACSFKENADLDILGPSHTIEKFQEAHVIGGREVSMEDPSLDVFDKELPFAVLPPIFLTIGGFEVFRDDLRRFAHQLESHDVNVEIYFGDELPHVFPMLWPLFYSESQKALAESADFCVRSIERAKLETARLESSQKEFKHVTKLKTVLSNTDIAGEVFKNMFV